MHEKMIVHRDLKPRNVLVSSLMRVHVIDLGLAIDLSDPLDLHTAAHKVVGTQVRGAFCFLPSHSSLASARCCSTPAACSCSHAERRGRTRGGEVSLAAARNKITRKF